MLKLCLASLAWHSTLTHQIVIHVNEGADGTLEWVKRQKLEHTHTPENVGICRSLNLARQKCRADYLVYLNDDMYVLPDWDRYLHEAIPSAPSYEPFYLSATMVQRTRMMPSVVLADYGPDPASFDEAGLLRDHQTGKLHRDDWNGATWPPSCVHHKWWDLIGGYSEELPFGFYSDLDFAMKLWRIGCRHFHGVGSSLVYHFGEMTTQRVRGPRGDNVKKARIHFLKKWKILPSTFSRYFLRTGLPFNPRTKETDLRQFSWEGLRLTALKLAYDNRRYRAA